MSNKPDTELTVRNMEDGRYEFHCPICNISTVPGLPCPVDRFTEIMQQFERDHAHDSAVTCLWRDDGDGWESDCGVNWEFIDGGPEDNGVIYCHSCGRRVVTETAVSQEASS